MTRRRFLAEERGRPFPVGARHPSARLTAAVVSALRRHARARRLPKGWLSDAAEYHGVSKGALSLAIGGQTWKHLEEKPVRAWKRVRRRLKRSQYTTHRRTP